MFTAAQCRAKAAEHGGSLPAARSTAGYRDLGHCCLPLAANLDWLATNITNANPERTRCVA